MNHTSGPWHRNIRSNGKYPVVFAGRNQHVATVSQQTNSAETEANIDLIAAAPDLLAFAQAVAAYPGADAGLVIAARAAIAKATGEQA